MSDDLDLGPDDREEALSRGFTQHDTLTFLGKPLRPMTAGTLDLLQKTGNRLLQNNQETPFSDMAGFALLHVRDEKESKKIRAEVWKGRSAWNEYIYKFLDETPNVEEELRKAADSFRQIIDDYSKGLTRINGDPNAKKNSGGQDG